MSKIVPFLMFTVKVLVAYVVICAVAELVPSFGTLVDTPLASLGLKKAS